MIKIGNLSDSDNVYFEKTTGQIVIDDNISKTEKTLTLEEYENLCAMQTRINQLAKHAH